MNILLAVDGSDYTKRMLAYLTTHDDLFTPQQQFTLFTAQSFCGARRMRAPLAPPRLSDPRKVLADAQAVSTISATVKPLALICAVNAATSASLSVTPAGIGSCQIRSSAGTSAPR